MADSDIKENLIPKRSRIKYKPEQVKVLEKAFEENHYPDTFRQEQLALQLSVTLDRVSIWFQNRRSKFKRQRQADHLAWMRKQIFHNKDDKDCQGLLGTPKLPVPTSACHVLSPLETQVPRDETAAETPSCSPSPRTWVSSSEENTYSSYRPNSLDYKPTYLSTPTRPRPDYSTTPVTTLQQSLAPSNDIFQIFSPAMIFSYIPSMHSIAQNHVIRSSLEYTEPKDMPLQQQPLQSIFQPDTKNENYSSCHGNNKVRSEENYFGSSATSKQTFGWLDSDSDSSPSKDKTLECLAQWC